MKFEISHDSLAKQIFEKASVDAKNRRKIKAMVERGLERYRQRKVFLTVDDLSEIRHNFHAINFTEEEEDLIRISTRALARKEKRGCLIVTAVILTLLTLLGLSILSTCKVGAAKLEIQHELDKSRADKFALEAKARLDDGFVAEALELAAYSNSYRSSRFEYSVPSTNKKILSDAYYKFLGNEHAVLRDIYRYKSKISNYTVSPSGDKILVQTDDKKVFVNTIPKSTDISFDYQEVLKQTEFIDADRKIILLSENGNASILAPSSDNKTKLGSNTIAVDSFFIDHDKESIICIDKNNTLRFFDYDGNPIKELVVDTAFIFDLNKRVCVSKDSIFMLLDFQGKTINTLTSSFPVSSLSKIYLSPDAKAIFIHTVDKGLLWNLDSQDTITIQHEHPTYVEDAPYHLENVFAPGDAHFFTIQKINPNSEAVRFEVTIRDRTTGQPLHIVEPCEYEVWIESKYLLDGTFSPDGRFMSFICGESVQQTTSTALNEISVVNVQKGEIEKNIPIKFYRHNEAYIDFLSSEDLLLRANSYKGGGIMGVANMKGNFIELDKVARGQIKRSDHAIKISKQKILNQKGEVFNFAGAIVSRMNTGFSNLNMIKSVPGTGSFVFIDRKQPNALLFSKIYSFENLVSFEKERINCNTPTDLGTNLTIETNGGIAIRSIVNSNISDTVFQSTKDFEMFAVSPTNKYVFIHKKIGRGLADALYETRIIAPGLKNISANSIELEAYSTPIAFSKEENTFVIRRYHHKIGENTNNLPHFGFDWWKIDEESGEISRLFTTENHEILSDYKFGRQGITMHRSGKFLAVTGNTFEGTHKHVDRESAFFMIDLEQGKIVATDEHSGALHYTRSRDKILNYGVDGNSSIKVLNANGKVDREYNSTGITNESRFHQITDKLFLIRGPSTQDFTKTDLKLFNLTNGEFHFEETSFNYSWDVSPDESQLLISFGESEARILDLLTETPYVKSSVFHEDIILVTRFSPNAKYFATASEDGVISLWDSNNYGLVSQFSGQPDPKDLQFSLDGKILISHTWNHELEIWHTPEAIMDNLKNIQPVDYSSSKKTSEE